MALSELSTNNHNAPKSDTLAPLPVLAEYGISPTLGFLPEALPLTELPDPYYKKWEEVARNLPSLILARRLRGIINELPVLEISALKTEAEWRRAYSLLGFMAHGYIWGDEKAADILPQSISVPLIEVSKLLEIPPVATYAGLCLWNFRPLFLDEEVDSLQNLTTLNTFTGSLDESWFYIVSVAIEARGAPVVTLMLTAVAAARQNDSATVTRCLQSFAERLVDLTSLLSTMHKSCDPRIFYRRIRPFLAGSRNMADAGLPHGVIYETGNPADRKYRQYSGGSNAQSSLIQFFDIALGVRHHGFGEEAGTGVTEKHVAFIKDMRSYMPGSHARFLDDFSRVVNIREYVDSHRDNKLLATAFDACIFMLGEFRNRHIEIVSRYIVIQRLEDASRSASVAKGSVPCEQPGMVGTGGTSLIPFLKRARDETGEAAIEEWTKRYMSMVKKQPEKSDVLAGQESKSTAFSGSGNHNR